MTDTAELANAIAEVKRVTPAGNPWTAEDIWAGDYEPSDIDRSIATILNAVVSGDLAEVIALRAEVNRRTAAGLTMARNLTFLEGDLHKAEARATAAEADAERLAAALTYSKEKFGFNLEVLDALAAHTQRVNAKETSHDPH